MGAPFRENVPSGGKRAILGAVPVLLLAAALLGCAVADTPGPAPEVPAPVRSGPDIYQSLTAEDVRDMLVLNGLRAGIEAVDGDALVADNRVVVDDFAAWYVYLYNCGPAAGDGCRDIEFRLAFSDAAPDLDQLNQWNARYRFTRAYRAPGGFAVLSMDINAEGGVTFGHVSALLPLWRRAMARYTRMLEGEAGPEGADAGDIAP